MAKANFKRIEDSSTIDDIDIEDGAFIVTGDGKTYIDFGTDRIPTSGTPDSQMSNISRNTVENKIIKEYVDTNFIQKGEILWTNPNPESNFDPQTITLSDNDYDVLEVYYISSNGTNDDFVSSTKTPKGYKINLVSLGYNASTTPIRVRRIDYVSDTTLSITEGKSGTNSTSNLNNSVCIPIYIIGYKTGLFE